MLLENLRKQLTDDEDDIPYAYQDHLGYWTIGIGILIDKRKGGMLYPEERQFIFENRINRFKTELLAKLPWTAKLDEARLGGLLNMRFQLGMDGLLKFTNSLRSIKEGRFEDAARNLKLSLWYEQTPERAERVIEQIRTGQWQFQ